MDNLKTALILAGGKGTRFKEKTLEIPKPMIEANKKPLLLHIVDIYSKYGVTNFVILGGYKIDQIAKYFENNFSIVSENTYQLPNSSKISILDTGLETMTGGRLRKGIEFIDDENFYLTYGDGVGTIDISKLTKFHFEQSGIVTLTATRPPARFGSLKIVEDQVQEFGEKDSSNEGWINGGFFVVNRRVIEYLDKDSEPFEKDPLEKLAKENQLFAYKHDGFWQPVDTIRELEILENQLSNENWKRFISN